MQNTDKINPYLGNEILREQTLKGTRKIVAENLMESYHNKIHATMYRYMEIKRLKEYKEKVNKGSIVDHFMRAVALTLVEKPELNATYENDIYRIYKDVNISYAVNTKRGLVTPVIRNADKLSLTTFLKTRREIIALVMDWKHQVSEIQGGTFTITNLGNFNVDFTLPIINPPQVAILGMARMCRLNISWDDSEIIMPKELLPISITYDHSIIDGAAVAEFAQILQDKINKPEVLWNEY